MRGMGYYYKWWILNWWGGMAVLQLSPYDLIGICVAFENIFVAGTYMAMAWQIENVFRFHFYLLLYVLIWCLFIDLQ